MVISNSVLKPERTPPPAPSPRHRRPLHSRPGFLPRHALAGGVGYGDGRCVAGALVGAVLGRPCWCLQGEVSLANNGGFVQASLDLSVARFLDSGAYRGIELDACGNGVRYNVPLRTADTRTPRMQFYDRENGRREFTCGIALTYPLPRVRTRSIGVASDRVVSSVVESR